MSGIAEKAVELEGAKNVRVHVEGTVLYILCDLAKDFGVSSTGKSTIIGTTSGNKPLGNSGASLGVNIFIKDLAKRNLAKTAVADLRKDDFQDCNETCKWRIEEDGTTLCIRIDFATVTEREASSGKTVLLATSGSFKSVAQTGISFNMNCYRKKEDTFDHTKIAQAAATGPRLKAGDAPMEAEGGFKVHYKSATEALLVFSGNTGALTEAVSLRDCKVDDCTVSLFVAPLRATRAKVKSTDEAPTAGALLDADAEKVTNVVVACSDVSKDDDFTLTITFDPSKRFGRTASGKSFVVASTAGFRNVGTAAGVALCRLQLTVYCPAPPLGKSDVEAAVTAVLGKRNPEEVGALVFKTVFAEVSAEMGASESQQADLKDDIKEAVRSYLGCSLASQSQSQ